MSTKFKLAEEKHACESTEYFVLFLRRIYQLIQGSTSVCTTESPFRVRFAQGEVHAYKKVVGLWDALIDELHPDKEK